MNKKEKRRKFEEKFVPGVEFEEKK